MLNKNDAKTFGNIFKLLAENITEEHKKTANELWVICVRDQGNHLLDFHPYQMWADEALMKLGFAKQGDECGGDVRYLGVDYELTEKSS